MAAYVHIRTLTLLQQQYEQFVVNYKNKPTHSKLEKKEGVYHSAQCSKILRIPIGNRSDFKRQTSTCLVLQKVTCSNSLYKTLE